MDFILDIDKLKELILIISRVYVMTHNVIEVVSIALMWGGIYAIFSQKKTGFGYLGINPNKHGIGLGITMFITGSIMAVLEGFIAIFTVQFGDVAEPLSTLSDGVSVIQGAGNSYHVLYIRFFGMYFTWLGYFFCFRGLYHAAGAGSDHMSGSKQMFMAFLGGLVIIFIGRGMTSYGS